MKLGKKLTCNSFCFVIIATLFYTLFLNVSFYRQAYLSLGMETIYDYVMLASFVVFIFCFINILFSILLVGVLRKPLLVLLLLISSAGSYFSVFYNIYIDEDMIANIVETNVGEASALITFRLFLWVFVFGVLPSLWVIFGVRVVNTFSLLKSFLYRVISIVVSLLVLGAMYYFLMAGYQNFIKSHKDNIKLITPSNYIYGSIRYMQELHKTHQPFVHIGEDAKRAERVEGHKKRLIVIVVGETSRAKNFSLNGYERETNPLLKKQTNLINFERATSCGTATAVSVPCMFSSMPREDYDGSEAVRQDNLLDILARTGVNILWKENDGGCKGVCTRVPFEEINLTEPKEKCPLGLCYDINLLKNLDAYINKQTDDTVIVLHTNGSHGPAYYLRYEKPQEKFTPACKLYEVDNCPLDQLVNAYDNTIVNVDYVLNATIELLKKHNKQFSTAMLYMSDHGESLGEEGYYLHGAPYGIAPDEQTHIPMIFWLSDSFVKEKKINRGCMSIVAKLNKKVSHDNLFHTVLGALNVSTREYDPKLDLFRLCEEPSK